MPTHIMYYTCTFVQNVHVHVHSLYMHACECTMYLIFCLHMSLTCHIHTHKHTVNGDNQALPHATTTTPTSPPPTIVQPPSASDIKDTFSNPMMMDEERTSAGAGTLLNLEGTTPSSDMPRQPSAHDFFSQLNWAEQTSGNAQYAPFQDHLGADSDSSSSGSSSSDSDDDDISTPRRDPFSSGHAGSKVNGVPGNGVPFVNFDAFDSSNDVASQGALKGQKQHGRKLPSPQSRRQEEAKLIEFSIAEGDDDDMSEQAPTTPTNVRQTKELFGSTFDPWGTPSTAYQRQYQGKTALEISDLLGLEDSDEHSTVSDVQSEVRAAGAETFSNHLDRKGMKTTSSDSSLTPTNSNQFDPFGSFLQQPASSAAATTATPLQPQQASVSSTSSSSTTTDPLFNLLLNSPSSASTTSGQPITISTAATTNTSTSSSPDPFASLLTPTVAPSLSQQHQQHHRTVNGTTSPQRNGHPPSVTNFGVGVSASGSHRRVSQPPRFNDHLSPLHGMQSPHGGTPGSGLGFVSSHSQPNLSAFGSTSHQQPHQMRQSPQGQGSSGGGGGGGNPSYMGGGSATSSPRSMSPTPFGAHSSSTGNLLQGGGGGQSTMAGGANPSQSSSSSRTSDPFAQFNLGFMSGANPPITTSIPHKSPSQPVFRPHPTHASPYQPYYMRQPAGEAPSMQGGVSGKAQSQPKAPQKTHSGSSISSGTGSVFAPRKPNYNPVIGPESRTGT